jgi:hypothetical protein
MSRFSGTQEHLSMFAKGSNTGALARLRYVRREEAVRRNAKTPPERRSKKKAGRRSKKKAGRA